MITGASRKPRAPKTWKKRGSVSSDFSYESETILPCL